MGFIGRLGGGGTRAGGRSRLAASGAAREIVRSLPLAQPTPDRRPTWYSLRPLVLVFIFVLYCSFTRHG